MLEHRSREVEIMDNLEISGQVVDQTLKELNKINQLLGGNGVSLSALKKMVSRSSAFSLIDLGCGGGDIMMVMARVDKEKGYRCLVFGH